ncbi:predicted protein [Uncinocarpus reesii 1704]|uniref:Uncharacterized protein n=1 Tax=Uncinocarpus reesii (strain UAMH 1704) TaxID=336963 RepID=C4JS73_UNCRE|nr:uncharacterized protein UREG_05312 [Uncinocarpus reesii 1704]EEP80470.1 predicted protein [Uncinocarpus reesii 1704]
MVKASKRTYTAGQKSASTRACHAPPSPADTLGTVRRQGYQGHMAMSPEHGCFVTSKIKTVDGRLEGILPPQLIYHSGQVAGVHCSLGLDWKSEYHRDNPVSDPLSGLHADLIKLCKTGESSISTANTAKFRGLRSCNADHAQYPCNWHHPEEMCSFHR